LDWDHNDIEELEEQERKLFALDDEEEAEGDSEDLFGEGFERYFSRQELFHHCFKSRLAIIKTRMRMIIMIPLIWMIGISLN
jgi:hypothetical protein